MLVPDLIREGVRQLADGVAVLIRAICGTLPLTPSPIKSLSQKTGDADKKIAKE